MRKRKQKTSEYHRYLLRSGTVFSGMLCINYFKKQHLPIVEICNDVAKRYSYTPSRQAETECVEQIIASSDNMKREGAETLLLQMHAAGFIPFFRMYLTESEQGTKYRDLSDFLRDKQKEFAGELEKRN